MPKKKKIKENKNWFKRHWLLTILGVIIILVLIINLSRNNETSENKNVVSLWDKETDYTLKECYQVCEEAMPTKIQENVCVGSCDAIGKQGEILDEFVNMYKRKILEDKNE